MLSGSREAWTPKGSDSPTNPKSPTNIAGRPGRWPKADQEDRPTTPLPGCDGTESGTAVNDWLDDGGKPKYGNDSA